jgi:phosphate-selective porin OprO/OprP
MRKVTLLAGLLLLAPAVSQAKSLDELLVQKGVITKAEAHSAAGASGSKTYWNQGTRFDFPSEGFSAQINSLIQTRYTFTDNDSDAGVENTSSFDMNLVTLTVSGNALHEEFSYKIDADFVGTSNSSGESTPHLRDAWLQWNTCDWASLRMGQFKTQGGRQFNADDQSLQFADRSAASDFFSLGRQNGLAAMGNFADGMLELSAGVYNGLSDGEGINRGGVDTKHTAVVAARINAMGKMNMGEEGDIGWTEDAAMTLGASYSYSDGSQTALGGDFTQDNIAVDVNFKYMGWGIHGEYFFENQDPDNGSGKVEPQGFYAQAGYFLMPKKLEVAARYAMIDCDDGLAGGSCSGNDELNEVGVSLNYHWSKHNLKGQLGYWLLNEDGLDGEDINTNKWMFQLSSYF